MVLTGERWELGLGAEAKLYLNVKNVKSATGFDKATIQVIKPDDTVFQLQIWFMTVDQHPFQYRGQKGI